MSPVDKIKAAAAKLDPDEQYEVFRWWIESDTFRQRQLAALKREIAKGIDDLEHGRYSTYGGSDAMRLSEEIGKSGREHLKKAGRNRKA